MIKQGPYKDAGVRKIKEMIAAAERGGNHKFQPITTKHITTKKREEK